MESVLNTYSRGGLPNKKDGRAPRIFQGLEKRIWYLLLGPTSKGPTAGAFAVPLRVLS